MALGTLAARGTIGPLFVGHGAQKLFGWFGGHGLDATAAGFESMGLRPGRRHAILGGAAEAIGGALLTLGAATPVATMLLTGAMTTAIRKVHAPNGPWVSSGGWEYNAVLIASIAAIADRGAGPLSVDAKLLPSFKGPVWTALAVGAGVAGSYLTTSPPLNEPAPEPEPAGPATAVNGTASAEHATTQA